MDMAMDRVTPLSVTVSGSFTASLGVDYTAVATLTVTDPSPVEGKGFTVLLLNGTATIGGVAFAIVGTLIRRYYHSGAWLTKVNPPLDGANTWTAAQTFRAASAVRSEAAATQDAMILAGRAGGSSSYASTLTTAALTASRTITFPDATGTAALLEREQKFTIRQRVETAGPTQGIQSDPSYVAGVLTTRVLGAGDALGDRYEVFRIGDGRGSVGANRLSVFQRRANFSGADWTYTQWCLGRYIDSIAQPELRFGGENTADAIAAICAEFGVGVEPTAGNGLLQLASGTTKANGIAFGTDTFLYRVGANILRCSAGFEVNHDRAYGAGVRMFDLGSSSKYFRCDGGAFQIVNDAFTQVLLSIADDGTHTIGYGTSAIHVINGSTQTTVGAAGGASALPATPSGYLRVSINGTTFKLPYFAD